MSFQADLPSTAPPHASGHAFTADASDLDQDLRDRLARVGEEQLSGAERFESMRSVWVESAAWLAVGAAIWLLTMLVWR